MGPEALYMLAKPGQIPNNKKTIAIYKRLNQINNLNIFNTRIWDLGFGMTDKSQTIKLRIKELNDHIKNEWTINNIIFQTKNKYS
ncbi:hypothetical protein C2G38_2179457 [Gigaspora rosea]|uniref:Uncharacterized protein n=1 Tax=Gigaspora rosea TaxID=44941 RepID=A0A397VGD0_9GLOM|nr:hypothetical protein C2G38_2179457 [Gigaspora rosea]